MLMQTTLTRHSGPHIHTEKHKNRRTNYYGEEGSREEWAEWRG